MAVYERTRARHTKSAYRRIRKVRKALYGAVRDYDTNKISARKDLPLSGQPDAIALRLSFGGAAKFTDDFAELFQYGCASRVFCAHDNGRFAFGKR